MKLHAEFKNSVLTIQQAEYIEYGWYLELHKNMWHVLEIPSYGGQVHLIDKFKTFTEALDCALLLT